MSTKNKIDDYVFETPGGWGLTIREYAAIHLMVPDSGIPELDEMIKKAIAQKTSKAAFSNPEKKA